MGNTLGYTCGTGREQNINRVIKWQTGKLDFSGIRVAEIFQQFGILQLIQVRTGVDIRCHHDFSDAGNALLDLQDLCQAIVLFAVIGIRCGAKQDLGFNLTEPVNYTIDAEIRRA